MYIEAIVLTGGESRRMGQDKASLPIDGVPQGKRIVDALRTKGYKVTVLGRAPIEGAEFLPDAEQFAGPAAAIARFEPTADAVFVASCDLPLFDVRLVELLARNIGDAMAAAPIYESWRQPLAALYRSEAFTKLRQFVAEGGRCPMGWLDQLAPVIVSERLMEEWGVDPRSVMGANTPDELAEALRYRRPNA